MLLAVNVIMFYGCPDVSWTEDTREVLTEPCQVEARSGSPTGVGRMLVPLHAHWGGSRSPCRLWGATVPRVLSERANAKAAWGGSTKSRLRSNKCGAWPGPSGGQSPCGLCLPGALVGAPVLAL